MLSSLCNHLNKKVYHDFEIFADITNENPGHLIKCKRPDIIMKENDSITAIELVQLSWTLLNQGNTMKASTVNLKMT